MVHLNLLPLHRRQLLLESIGRRGLDLLLGIKHVLFLLTIIAAVSIIAEVTAQADDVILNSGKSEVFVQTKLTGKYVTCT